MNWPGVGAIFLTFAVMLGAFGAHALRSRFDSYAMDVWEKAVFYHFVHALGILITSVLARSGALPSTAADRVCWLLAAGVLIFSGSLYALAATGLRTLGAMTPLGGLAFIGAWLLLAFELFRHSR